MAKLIVSKRPKPLEKYLPEYRRATDFDNSIATPSLTQRGFANVLSEIGTPSVALEHLV